MLFERTRKRVVTKNVIILINYFEFLSFEHNAFIDEINTFEDFKMLNNRIISFTRNEFHTVRPEFPRFSDVVVVSMYIPVMPLTYRVFGVHSNRLPKSGRRPLLCLLESPSGSGVTRIMQKGRGSQV